MTLTHSVKRVAEKVIKTKRLRSILTPFAQFIVRRILPKIAYPVLFGPLRGAKFVLGALAGEGGGGSVYLNAIEPQQTSALVETLNDGKVFIDIGANVGYYTILGSRLVGKKGLVIAVEPTIRNIYYLYRHVVLNKAHNVLIVSAAVADALSVATFSPGVNYAEGHLSSECGPLEGNSGNSATIVPTVTLDDVVRKLDVIPDVIKIDVEGAEYLVLQGAYSTIIEAKPIIFLSVHSELLRLKCLKYLSEIGYAIEVLSKDKLNPTEYLARYK